MPARVESTRTPEVGESVTGGGPLPPEGRYLLTGDVPPTPLAPDTLDGPDLDADADDQGESDADLDDLDGGEVDAGEEAEAPPSPTPGK